MSNKPKPKTNSKASLKVNKGIIDSLRHGIAAIETGGVKGDPYSSPAGDKNKDGKPDSSALGKYQFLKSYWWDTTSPIMGFKQFAKSKGSAFGDVNSWEDVKGNKALQEAYFAYYSQEHLIPEAQKAIAKGNPLGLTIEKASAIIHKNGFVAGKKIIASGKLGEETATNASDLRYLKVFDGAIEEAGFKQTSVEDYTKMKVEAAKEFGEEPELTEADKKVLGTAKERVAKYQERWKDINKMMGEDPTTAEILRKELYQEIVNNGDDKEFNSFLDGVEQKNKSFQKLNEVFGTAEFDYIHGADGSKTPKELSTDLFTKEELEQIKKDFPEVGKHLKIKHEGDKARFVVRQGSRINEENPQQIQNLIKDYNKVGREFFGEGYQPVTLNHADPNRGSGDKAEDLLKDIGKGLFGMNVLKDGTIKMPDRTYNFTNPVKIDPEKITKQEKESEIDRLIKSEGKPTPEMGEVKEEDETGGDTDDNDAFAKDKEELKPASATEEYLSQKLALLGQEKNKANYDKSKIKQELPINAITGMALGLIGNEQAKNAKIPLRTEDVGEAFRQYKAEVAKKAKQGLPVEMEAAMVNQLAEVYQGGLETIQNHSAGNRALILGNQGQLEHARNKGLIDIQLADYEAKQKAFQQYGDLVKYESEFDARRDIANHGIKYQEAKTKQTEGKELAAAGFAQLAEDLKYQRENGPGSANDMYRSMLMQKMFGFDPKMKDDGSGTVPGTQSYFDKIGANLKNEKAVTMRFQEKYQTLNQDQKEFVDKTGGPGKIGLAQADRLLDYIRSRPDLDYANMDATNIDQAIQKEDFGLLAVSREEAVAAKKMPTSKPLSANPEANLAQENQDPNGWMYNDFGNGVNADGTPAPPPDPTGRSNRFNQSAGTGLLSGGPVPLPKPGFATDNNSVALPTYQTDQSVPSVELPKPDLNAWDQQIATMEEWYNNQ